MRGAQSKCLYSQVSCVYIYADVAELADALDSGSSGSDTVGVQVPSSAPVKNPVKFRLCGVFAIYSYYGIPPM